jgi:cytoskeletal protein CcmA (bactofilin family)
MTTIGESIIFKGELTGDEDLEIGGQVEGTVCLKNHQVTIGANGSLRAEVTAKSIIVIGQIEGNLVASERIEIQESGTVKGDVKTPRLNVQEGAVLNGTIDMSPAGTAEVKKPAAQTTLTSSTAGSSPHSTAQADLLKRA